MQDRGIYRFLNDLPILPKLLLIAAIPFLSLILFSVMLYLDVQSVLQDEERLNNLYLVQKTAAQYMQLVIDLENTFRGYVISEDDRYLQPYQQAREGIAAVGKDLAVKLSPDQEQAFTDLQKLVTRFVEEKEELVQSIKSGKRSDAVRHVVEGRARETLAEIRKSMTQLEQAEQQVAQQELSRLSHDRTVTGFVILGGGVITLGLVIFALALIAHSIATPISALSKVVGATAGDVVQHHRPAAGIHAPPDAARRSGEVQRFLDLRPGRVGDRADPLLGRRVDHLQLLGCAADAIAAADIEPAREPCEVVERPHATALPGGSVVNFLNGMP